MADLNDKQARELQTKIGDLVEQLRYELGLAGFQVDQIFTRGPLPDTPADSTTYMAMIPSWYYRYGKLYVSLEACAGLDDEGLERAALHELLHLMVSPMRSEEHPQTRTEEMLEERTCSDLAQSIQFILGARLRDQADRYELEIRRLKKQLKSQTQAA